MTSTPKLKAIVVAVTLTAALLSAAATGPVCLPLPGDAWRIEVRCFLWLSAAPQTETTPLAFVSLPPDWKPDK